MNRLETIISRAELADERLALVNCFEEIQQIGNINVASLKPPDPTIEPRPDENNFETNLVYPIYKNLKFKEIRRSLNISMAKRKQSLETEAYKNTFFNAGPRFNKRIDRYA